MTACKDKLVKVCGITRAEDAQAAARAGARLLGFIFHPKSPRRVTPEQAAAIETPGLMRVGVFVDQTVDEVLAVMERACLDLAQLHGDQDEAFCRAVGKSRVMRAFWPERHPDLAGLEAELERFAPYIRFALMDAGASGGGHGRAMDFSRLAGLRCAKTWLLAGGLGPDNLAEAMAACTPCGVDLNSGVESAPGVKDSAKLKTAMDAFCRGPACPAPCQTN